MNEDAFGGEALGAVTGDGVAVVEMTMFVGVEFDLAAVVEAGGQATIGMDRLDYCHIAIGYAERFVGSGELDAVAYGELAFDLSVDPYSGEAAGIVDDKFLVWFFNGEQVCGWVIRDHRCIGSGLDSVGFAPA